MKSNQNAVAVHLKLEIPLVYQRYLITRKLLLLLGIVVALFAVTVFAPASFQRGGVYAGIGVVVASVLQWLVEARHPWYYQFYDDGIAIARLDVPLLASRKYWMPWTSQPLSHLEYSSWSAMPALDLYTRDGRVYRLVYNRDAQEEVVSTVIPYLMANSSHEPR